MSRRKAAIRPLPEHWTVLDEFQVNGRWLRPGVEFRVRRESGRFRFWRAVSNGSVTWIDARSPDGRFRSFATDRVRTVHVKKMLREAS